MASQGLGRDFSTLWVASAVSNLGDGVRIVALPLFAAAITRDPVLISVLEASIWLPWLFFALPGGALIDRVERMSLMRNAQLARMVVMLGLVLATVVGVESIALLCVVAFLIGIGEIFVDGTTQAVVPDLVAEADLERANGRLIGSQFAFDQFAGPPLGAFLFSAARAAPFALDAISFGISSMLFIALRRRSPLAPRDLPTTRLRADVVEGLRALWANTVVRSVTLAVAVTNLTSMMWGAILVLYVLEELGDPAIGYGILISAGAAGGLAGTVVASRIARAIGRHHTLTFALLLSGVAPLVMGVAPNLTVAAAAEVVFGFMIGTFNVVGRSLRQSVVPGRLLGRVVSSARLIGYGVIPLGALIGGWLASTFGLRMPFYVGGAAVVAVGFLLPLWVNEQSIAAARAEIIPRESDPIGGVDDQEAHKRGKE